MNNFNPDTAMIAHLLGRPQKQAPVRREQVIKDLENWLATQALSDEEAERLFTIIARRVRSATCSKCLKLKAKFEGEVRDKKFVCRDCRFSI
jgi:hypothetical protein